MALYLAAGFEADGDGVRRFVQDTLQIPNVSHEDIIAELQHLAASQQPEGANTVERVGSLYRLLQDMYRADPEIASYLRYIDPIPPNPT